MTIPRRRFGPLPFGTLAAEDLFQMQLGSSRPQDFVPDAAWHDLFGKGLRFEHLRIPGDAMGRLQLVAPRPPAGPPPRDQRGSISESQANEVEQSNLPMERRRVYNLIQGSSSIYSVGTRLCKGHAIILILLLDAHQRHHRQGASGVVLASRGGTILCKKPRDHFSRETETAYVKL